MQTPARTTDGAAQARRIRSFVRREGRLTPGQQKALKRLWPKYGLSVERELRPAAVFGRSAPLTLEVGFGNGASLAAMAANEPESDFIGIEVHRPGVGRLLRQLEQQGLGNVRVFCQDAVEVLEQRIPDASLQRVLLLFPDPWPKRNTTNGALCKRTLSRSWRAGSSRAVYFTWRPTGKPTPNKCSQSWKRARISSTVAAKGSTPSDLTTALSPNLSGGAKGSAMPYGISSTGVPEQNLSSSRRNPRLPDRIIRIQR